MDFGGNWELYPGNQLPEPHASMIHGALVTIGFVVPGLLLTFLINRAAGFSQSSQA